MQLVAFQEPLKIIYRTLHESIHRFIFSGASVYSFHQILQGVNIMLRCMHTSDIKHSSCQFHLVMARHFTLYHFV